MAREMVNRLLLSRVWCTLLLLFARATWSVLIMVGIMTMDAPAYAAPEPCPKIIAKTPQGLAVRIGEGCDLFQVVRAYPLIDPATGKPYPRQIQLRSIFAANQDHYEDGVFVHRSVMRNCVRPGKPDPYADKDELENVCKNGDGLAYYFGIPGVKIMIPSQRQYTEAELAEMGRKQLDDELAEQQAAAAKQQAEQQAERQVKANKEAAAKIYDLENKLKASQMAIASLRTSANRGRWFWGMVIGILCLALYGVGSTMVAIRARRIKPVIASGRYYPDVETASEILSAENIELKSLLAEAQRNAKAARMDLETANSRIVHLEKEVAAQRVLEQTRTNERDDARRECKELREKNARLDEEGSRLNGMYLRLEAELKDRQRPSFRPPGMQSDDELRKTVAELREANAALEGVRKRQFKQIEQAQATIELLNRRITGLERMKVAIEHERDQAVEASRTALARAAKLRLVKSLPGLVSDEDESPANVKDLPLVLVSDNLSAETSGDTRHSLLPPPLSTETNGRQSVLQEMSAFLEEAWNVKRDLSEAKNVLDKLSQAIVKLREKSASTRDEAETAMYVARIGELERKVAVWRQTWEALCQNDQDMERMAHERGFDAFVLRSSVWQSESSAAEQASAISAYRVATEALYSVMAPEDRFASLQQEIYDLRQERNVYRDALNELASVAYVEDDAACVRTKPAPERARHIVGTLTDICRQRLGAAKQNFQGAAESEPPISSQTTSDFVRTGTLASRQTLGLLDLQTFQSALAKAPSYLVADVVKSCIREWLYRILREGERVYTVYTKDELYELNAFLCSPLIGGSDVDLSVTIGKTLEGYKVQHASDSSCMHPSFKSGSQRSLFKQTARPGDGKFDIGDVAALLNRNA